MKTRTEIAIAAAGIFILAAGVHGSYRIAQTRAIPLRDKFFPGAQYSHTAPSFEGHPQDFTIIPHWIVWYKPETNGTQHGIHVSIFGEASVIVGKSSR
jgi:hypothetical protein